VAALLVVVPLVAATESGATEPARARHLEVVTIALVAANVRGAGAQPPETVAAAWHSSRAEAPLLRASACSDVGPPPSRLGRGASRDAC